MFRLIYIARFNLSLRVCFREAKYETFHERFSYLHYIYCDVEPGCHLNCLHVVGRFLSRISSCRRTFFLLRRHSFTSRKVCISQETLQRFLQLSYRAYVSRARCIGLVLFLVVLAPHDDDSLTGVFSRTSVGLFSVLYMPLFGLVQSRPWFPSSICMWMS